MQEKVQIEGKDIVVYWKAAFFLFVAFLFYKSWLYIKPFFQPIFLAALLAAFLSGMKSHMTEQFCVFFARTFKIKKDCDALSSIVITILTACMFVLPLYVSSLHAVKEIGDMAHIVSDEQYREQWRQRTIEEMQHFITLYPQSKTIVQKAVNFVSMDQVHLLGGINIGAISKDFGGSVVAMATSTFTTAASLIVQLCIMLIALYIFLQKGGHIIIQCAKLFPLSVQNTEHMLRGIASGTNALFKSMIITGGVQGGMAIFGVSLYVIPHLSVDLWNLVFLGFVMMFCAAIALSFVATGGVIITAIIAAMQGHYLAAILLAIYAIPVGISDNYVKSKIIGQTIVINPFIIMAFIFGGAMTEGAIGVVSGPFLIILIVNIGGILLKEYNLFCESDAIPIESTVEN